MDECQKCHRKIKVFAKGLCRNCYERQRKPDTACDNCGKPFYKSPHRKRRDRFHYCSTDCLSAHRVAFGLLEGSNNPAYKGGSVSLICATCSTRFQRERCQYTEGQDHYYCSPECQHRGLTEFYSGPNSPHAGKWITRPCNYCDNPLTRPTWQFRELAFCDSACFGNWKSLNWTGPNNPVWKGGHENYYGPNWKRQARRARARDNHICQRCSITEDKLGKALDVHHIVRFGDFDGDWKSANRLENLTSLCHSCHMFVENEKR